MQIFLSHSWHDKPIVMQLAHSLQALGPSVEVWHDCERLRLGRSISRNVESAIDQTSLLALVWSSDAAESKGVAHELAYASQQGVPIVPVLTASASSDLPELPAEAGDDPLTVQLGSDPTSEGIDLAAAALLEIVVNELAQDPEVRLPGFTDSFKKVTAFGAVLRSLSDKTGTSKVLQKRRQWRTALNQSQETVTETMNRHRKVGETSIEVLDAVLEATKRRPTNSQELLGLRRAAMDLHRTDPIAAGQAVKVIDLRLADPLY